MIRGVRFPVWKVPRLARPRLARFYCIRENMRSYVPVIKNWNPSERPSTPTHRHYHHRIRSWFTVGPVLLVAGVERYGHFFQVKFYHFWSYSKMIVTNKFLKIETPTSFFLHDERFLKLPMTSTVLVWKKFYHQEANRAHKQRVLLSRS